MIWFWTLVHRKSKDILTWWAPFGPEIKQALCFLSWVQYMSYQCYLFWFCLYIFLPEENYGIGLKKLCSSRWWNTVSLFMTIDCSTENCRLLLFGGHRFPKLTNSLSPITPHGLLGIQPAVIIGLPISSPAL